MYQECWYTLTHAQTVYTRPSPPTRGPGDEASEMLVALMVLVVLLVLVVLNGAK